MSLIPALQSRSANSHKSHRQRRKNLHVSHVPARRNQDVSSTIGPRPCASPCDTISTSLVSEAGKSLSCMSGNAGFAFSCAGDAVRHTAENRGIFILHVLLQFSLHVKHGTSGRYLPVPVTKTKKKRKKKRLTSMSMGKLQRVSVIEYVFTSSWGSHRPLEERTALLTADT